MTEVVKFSVIGSLRSSGLSVKARKGSLTLLGCTVQTPALIFYTRGASVPHITEEVLRMITEEKHILQIPLLTTVHMENVVEKYGGRINELSGLSKHPAFLCFGDPAVSVPATQLEKFTMPLWARVGKIAVDSQRYMSMVEKFKPAIYSSLSDPCTSIDSAKKRVIKSVLRSETMFLECLERHNTSDYLKNNSSILGVIVGGYNLEQRQKSLDVLLGKKDDISGFVFDGFDSDATNLKTHRFENKKEIVQKITEQLPENKVRLVPGCWNAPTLLDFISAGWDLFDTSDVYLTTERNCAYVFNYKTDSNQEIGTEQSHYEIDLEEIRYKDKFIPLVEKCECLTCTKYTRAYINHLIVAKEMLAGVLLTIHNMHHYLKFFDSIRSCETEDQLNGLKELINRQYEQHLEFIKTTPKEKAPPSPTTKRKRLSPERSPSP